MRLAAVIGLFVTGLAWLGASRAFGGSPEAPILLSAIVAFAQVAWVSRDRDEPGALASTFSGFLLPAALWVLTSPTSHVPEGALILRWLVVGVSYAVTFLPVALLLHRGARFDARDAADRALLVSACWLTTSLASAAIVMRAMRAAGASYTGWAAPLLGPALVALLALAGLSAAGVILRGARWIGLWRRVRRGGAWRVVRGTAWEGVAPGEAWFTLRGVELDGVVVRRVTSEGGAYREAGLEVAVARVPLDDARVARVLVRRVVAAVVLVVALSAIATGPLASLRW